MSSDLSSSKVARIASFASLKVIWGCCSAIVARFLQKWQSNRSVKQIAFTSDCGASLCRLSHALLSNSSRSYSGYMWIWQSQAMSIKAPFSEKLSILSKYTNGVGGKARFVVPLKCQSLLTCFIV